MEKTHFSNTITIHAPVTKVWTMLTEPQCMQQWLTENTLRVSYEPGLGNTMQFKGVWHGEEFNDKGIIVAYEPEKVFAYRHWSGFSNLGDTPDCTITFTLHAEADNTLLELHITDIANEVIYGHLKMYWPVTLQVLKKMIEKKYTIV